jgi:hypothetical protein
MVAIWESVTAELFDAGLQPTLIADLTVGSSLDRTGGLGVRLWEHHFKHTVKLADLQAVMFTQKPLFHSNNSPSSSSVGSAAGITESSQPNAHKTRAYATIATVGVPFSTAITFCRGNPQSSATLIASVRDSYAFHVFGVPGGIAEEIDPCSVTVTLVIECIAYRTLLRIDLTQHPSGYPSRRLPHVLGHFPQNASPFMNWRTQLLDDSLLGSLQISDRL